VIVDLYEAIDRMLWALLAWIAVFAALGALLLLGVAAVVAWAWRAARRRPRRPLWARGRLRARILARTRARGSQAPQEPSEPPDFEEAA
jgi:hypothetical protein